MNDTVQVNSLVDYYSKKLGEVTVGVVIREDHLNAELVLVQPVSGSKSDREWISKEDCSVI
jgi:hypothetical protein